MKSMIAFSIASSEEWNVLKQELTYSFPCCKSPFGEYFFLNDILYFRSGTRKALSSAACQWMIDHFSISHLFVIGTCAGIQDKHKEQQLFQFDECFQSDMMVKELSELQCIKTAELSCLEKLNFLPKGKISTQDKPIILLEDKEMLQQEGMDCADMESAAVALIAKLNQIPCTIIKGISDFPRGIEAFSSQDEIYSINTKSIMKKIVKEILPILQNETY